MWIQSTSCNSRKAKAENRNWKSEMRKAALSRPMSLCGNFVLGSFSPKKAFGPIRTFCPILRLARFSRLPAPSPNSSITCEWALKK
jgi:hypothetical protein